MSLFNVLVVILAGALAIGLGIAIAPYVLPTLGWLLVVTIVVAFTGAIAYVFYRIVKASAVAGHSLGSTLLQEVASTIHVAFADGSLSDRPSLGQRFEAGVHLVGYVLLVAFILLVATFWLWK